MKPKLRIMGTTDDGHSLMIFDPFDYSEEQELSEILEKIFIRVAPGLDSETGRLIPGVRFEETIETGPRFHLVEDDEGISHIAGITIHPDLVDELDIELSRKGIELVR